MPNTSPKFQSNFSSDEINRAIGWANDESGGYGLQDTFKTTVDGWSASVDAADVNLGKYYVELTNPFADLPVKIYAIHNGDLYDIANYRSVQNTEYVKIYSNIAFTLCDIYMVGLLESHEQLKTTFPEYNIQYVYAGQTITSDVVGAGAPSAYVYKHNTQLPYNKTASDSGYDWVPSEAVLVGWSLTEDGSELVGPIYTETGDPAPTVPYYTSGDITLYAVCRIPVRYYKNNTRISGLETATTYLYPTDQNTTIELINPYNPNINDVFIEGWHLKGDNANRLDLIRYVSLDGASGVDNNHFIDIELTYEASDVSGWVWSKVGDLSDPVYEGIFTELIKYIGHDKIICLKEGDKTSLSADNCYIPHFHDNAVVYYIGPQAFCNINGDTITHLTRHQFIAIPHTARFLDSPFIFAYGMQHQVYYGSTIQRPLDYYYCGDLSSWCYLNYGYSGDRPDVASLLWLIWRLIGSSGVSTPFFITAYSNTTVSDLTSPTSYRVEVSNNVSLYINLQKVTENLTIPNPIDDGTAFIGNFGGYNLRSVVLSNSPVRVGGLGAVSFCNCRNIVSISGLSTNVSSIAKTCYTSSSRDLSINITSGNILANAFSDIGRLRNVSISYGVQTIGKNAFKNCQRLYTINLPASISIHADGAFVGCTVLKNIYFNGDIEQWCNIGGLSDLMRNCNKTPNLYINGGLLNGDIVVPETVTNIPSFAFKSCTGITSFACSCNVDKAALVGCYNIESLTIGAESFISHSELYNNSILCDIFTNSYLTAKNTDQVSNSGMSSMTFNSNKYYIPPQLYNVTLIQDATVSLANNIFVNCFHIRSVVLPSNISNVGTGMFYNCQSLSNIVLPPSIADIPSQMFYRCSSLGSIAIPQSVNEIGYQAFYGTNLDSIELFVMTEGIEETAFQNASINNLYFNGGVDNWCCRFGDPGEKGLFGITRVQIQHMYIDNVEVSDVSIGPTLTTNEIDPYVFYYCKSLTNVVITDSIRGVGDYAFSSCDNLVTVEIGRNVSYLGDHALAFNGSLTRVIFTGRSINEFGSFMLANCPLLTDIDYAGTMDDWRDINKDSAWHYGSSFTVHCTDGDIQIS